MELLVRDTKAIESFLKQKYKKITEMSLFRNLKKEVETGASGTQDYVIKKGPNKDKIAKTQKVKMEPEQVLTKLRRALDKRLSLLSLSVTSGGVDTMEKYRYIIGQITALESVRQEIISLLNDKEENENSGTVIDLNRGPKS